MNGVYILAAGTASSVIDEAMKTTIQSGFDTMTATVSDVVAIAVVASVAVICLTAGVNYALKKIRGVMSKAS